MMSDFFSSGWLFAGGAAVVTLVVTGWTHVKNFYQQIASRVITTMTVSGYEAEAIVLYLKSKFKASRWGPRAYLGWMLYVRPRSRVQLVPMEITPPAGKMYWQGWRPLWTYKSSDVPDTIESGVNSHDYSEESLSLSFLRGTFDPDRLVIEASEWFNRQIMETYETGGRRHYIKHVYGTAGKSLPGIHGNDHGGSQYVNAPSSSNDVRGCLQFRSLAWSFSELGPDQSQPGKAFDNLALSADAEALVEEARRWKSSERWYKDRGVPWRRGWLLHGQPGTGKTALARAVAEDLDLPVFVFDLASLYNNELQQEWAKMLSEVPCMALIEDIDAVFEGRRNVSGRDRQHLTFDCLLNCMDGIERADGLFVVITTNRLEKLDRALGRPDEGTMSTRPGRIDRVLELQPLDESGRRKLVRRILAEWPAYWELVVREGDGDTPAQFQERCSRRALSLHYGETDHNGRATSSAVEPLVGELVNH